MYKRRTPDVVINLAPRRKILSALTLTRVKKEYENITSVSLPTHFLYYHEEGDLKINSGQGHQIDLLPGDVYFLKANRSYPSNKPSSSSYRSVKIYFDTDNHDRLCDERSLTDEEVVVPWFLRTQGDPEIFNLFQELTVRNTISNAFSIREQSIYLNLLLVKLSKMHHRPVHHIDQKILKVKEIIEVKSTVMLSIDELASETGMSRSTLMTSFKKYTGSTIINYHTEVRMKNACQLIQMEPKIKQKEIASLLGFYDEFHFGRTFKSHLGMTVSEYKRRVNETV